MGKQQSRKRAEQLEEYEMIMYMKEVKRCPFCPSRKLISESPEGWSKCQKCKTVFMVVVSE